MGIKHFFYWFSHQFDKQLYPLKKTQIVSEYDVVIDNLMLDMNGIIHAAAQYIYKYGNNRPATRLLRPTCQIQNIPRMRPREAVYEEVCNIIEKLISICKPTKRLILCIDGVAPLSKQYQQRQRRFRSAMEATQDPISAQFDRNSITPGTEFLDGLSRYIDWYIRKRISECDIWQNFIVIFSNEKVPQEGEHKIVNFVRKFGEPDESYCINGLDADLIMLSLSTHKEKFYIIRENTYARSDIEYTLVDIGSARNQIIEQLRWQSTVYSFEPERALNDFVFLAFSVGNDFLPHMPSIEIIQQGLELLIEVYKQVASVSGHLTSPKGDGSLQFDPMIYGKFLSIIGSHEEENYFDRLNVHKPNHPDDLLIDCSKLDADGKLHVKMDLYRDKYNQEYFPGKNMEEVAYQYFRGLDWVLAYYSKGVPSWKWFYPYHYAPHASTLANYASVYVNTRRPFILSTPLTPFQQLLSVLPPQSSRLLPKPLGDLLLTEPLKKYCPDKVKINLRGTNKEYEGVTLIGFMPQELMKQEYFKVIGKVSDHDRKRDRLGRSYIYEFSPAFSTFFKSYYGDIKECVVTLVQIDL